MDHAPAHSTADIDQDWRMLVDAGEFPPMRNPLIVTERGEAWLPNPWFTGIQRLTSVAEGIALGFTDVSWKRHKRNGSKAGTCQRLWHVTTHDPHIETLEEALEILAIVRAGEAL